MALRSDHIMAVLAIMVLLAGQARAQGPCLTLADAIDASLSFDPRIEGAAADKDSARANVLAAQSRNLPQISAFGQTGLGDTPPLDRRRDDQIGVQLNQELYSFGSRKFATEAARRQYEAATYGVEETAQNVAQGVAISYLDYQRALRLVAIAAEQEATYATDAQSAASRLERNVITLTDASQIRARYARARSDTISARVEAEAALARLSVLVNRDVQCIAEGSTEAFIGQYAGNVLSLAPDAAVDAALSQSMAVRRAEAQIAAARASMGEAARANMPTISANAFALYEYDSFTEEFEDDSRVGLSLSQNIFTGGRNSARRADARARLRGARADADLQRIVVEDLVKRALARARAQQASGLALLEASEQARIQLDSTLREYELGTKTLTDLVLATEDYYTAASQETNARFDFYASLIRVYAAMGMLTESVGR